MPMSIKYPFVVHVQLPPGWSRLGGSMLDTINGLVLDGDLDPGFEISRLKELHGGLHVAHNSDVLILKNLIVGYQKQAATTCQNCGIYPAALHRRVKWVRTMCSECAATAAYSIVLT